MPTNNEIMIPGPPVLIHEKSKYETSAFFKKGIVICVISNCLLFITIVWAFYSSTASLTNLEDSSPGLPLKTDIILVLSVLANIGYTLFLLYFVISGKWSYDETVHIESDLQADSKVKRA
jgi:hypothetical protein